MVFFPKSKWINNWGIEQSNANFLDKFVTKNKPKIILETGTFEGQATYVMAQAADKNNNGCVIYTIDYNGDPTTDLELEKWLLLEKIRNQNLSKIKENFPNVQVKFIEGDSRVVLKELFSNNNIKKVDLFYQDSMHFKEGIESEWNLVKNYILKDCHVIFDDLCLKGVKKFRDWFKTKYKKEFEYSEENYGHKQFIVKKK
jgi:hypothetical protein